MERQRLETEIVPEGIEDGRNLDLAQLRPGNWVEGPDGTVVLIGCPHTVTRGIPDDALKIAAPLQTREAGDHAVRRSARRPIHANHERIEQSVAVPDGIVRIIRNTGDSAETANLPARPGLRQGDFPCDGERQRRR